MPITFEHVKHVYSTGTPYQYDALQDINLNITENKITAIIGQTGSGKSTLIQHLNALLLPTEGTIHILDRTISAKETPKKSLDPSATQRHTHETVYESGSRFSPGRESVGVFFLDF